MSAWKILSKIFYLFTCCGIQEVKQRMVTHVIMDNDGNFSK